MRRPPAPWLPLLCLGLLLAGCGRPDGAHGEAAREPPKGLRASWLPGLDKNEPLGDGPLWRKTIVSRAYDLEPWRVNFHAEPFRVRPFNTKEDVFITRWRSNTETPDGERCPDDIHCHTFLSDVFPAQLDYWLFVGVYTDGFTPVFELPEGFGVLVPRGRGFQFLPMFNNRHPAPRKARMRLEIDYAPRSSMPSLVPLSAFTVSSTWPDLYWVPPREPGTPLYRDVRRRVVTMPISGRVHAIGAHLHPYGRSVELKRVRDDKVMFTARMIEAEDIADERLTTYKSKQGFFIRRGERYAVTTIYENVSDERIDAMGGLFVFFDPKGKPDA